MNACLPGCDWNATPRSLSPLERNIGFWTLAKIRSIGPAVTRDQSPAFLRNSKTVKTSWKVKKTEDGKFIVTGEKIEKFARRTDMNNYESLNRLRDIMKKMGIRAELTSLGAEPESIISIAGKEFTLVEDW